MSFSARRKQHKTPIMVRFASLCLLVTLRMMSCSPLPSEQDTPVLPDVSENAQKDYSEHQKQVEAHRNLNFGFGSEQTGQHGFDHGNSERASSYDTGKQLGQDRSYKRDRGYGFEKAYAYSRETSVLDLSKDNGHFHSAGNLGGQDSKGFGLDSPEVHLRQYDGLDFHVGEHED